jgi:hypothetical protein
MQKCKACYQEGSADVNLSKCEGVGTLQSSTIPEGKGVTKRDGIGDEDDEQPIERL